MCLFHCLITFPVNTAQQMPVCIWPLLLRECFVYIKGLLLGAVPEKSYVHLPGLYSFSDHNWPWVFFTLDLQLLSLSTFKKVAIILCFYFQVFLFHNLAFCNISAKLSIDLEVNHTFQLLFWVTWDRKSKKTKPSSFFLIHQVSQNLSQTWWKGWGQGKVDVVGDTTNVYSSGIWSRSANDVYWVSDFLKFTEFFIFEN